MTESALKQNTQDDNLGETNLLLAKSVEKYQNNYVANNNGKLQRNLVHEYLLLSVNS